MTLEQQHKIEDALNRDLTPEEIAIIDDDLTGDYEVDDIVELIKAKDALREEIRLSY
jgi:serine/threonine protein kinase HipA of HipAB toxin-antitoxin module